MAGTRPDHDGQLEEHLLEWAEIARIVFVAMACAAVWFPIPEGGSTALYLSLGLAALGYFRLRPKEKGGHETRFSVRSVESKIRSVSLLNILSTRR